MPESLFAVCRIDGDLVPRRVRLSGDVQDQVEAIFASQEQSFFEGVNDEVPFNGDWKPDPNELLTVNLIPEAGIFRETLSRNANTVDDLDLANYAAAGVKALFTGQAGDDGLVLVQRFTLGQVLTRRFSLFLAGNTFRRLTAPTFDLANSLTFVIDEDLIKFKSFSNLHMILDVGNLYQEATAPVMQNFAGHPKLEVADIEVFIELADRPTRKLINSIIESGVLDNFTALQIRDAAKATQLDVVVEGECLVFPDERRDQKELLRFLDESRYSGPLSGRPYVTNSRKLV